MNLNSVLYRQATHPLSDCVSWGHNWSTSIRLFTGFSKLRCFCNCSCLPGMCCCCCCCWIVCSVDCACSCCCCSKPLRFLIPPSLKAESFRTVTRPLSAPLVVIFTLPVVERWIVVVLIILLSLLLSSCQSNIFSQLPSLYLDNHYSRE